MGKHARVDWKKARRLHERDGKSFTEIAETLGCSRNTVAAHARRGSWVNGAQVEREASAQRRQKIFDLFVARDAEAIRANLSQKHEATSLALGIILGELRSIDAGERLLEHKGDQVVEVDKLTRVRRATLALQNVEVIDRSLAGLKDDGWRSAGGAGEGDSSAESAAVRDALEELARDGSG